MSGIQKGVIAKAIGFRNAQGNPLDRLRSGVVIARGPVS
jgi:hypothetical protein